MTTYRLKIREFHLDTFGHVNNATYLQILEEARWEMITQNGYGLEEVQRRGQGPVMLEVHLSFKHELHLREEIEIVTQAHKYDGKVGMLEQKILKKDGRVAAEAQFKFGLFDTKARKLISPTPEWLKAVGLE